MNNNKKLEYEVVPHQKLKHVHIFVTDITRCGAHLHSEMEVFAVIRGEGTAYRNSDSTPLQPGSIVLFNPNEAHSIEGKGDGVVAVVIQIAGHFMQDYFPQFHNTVFEQRVACTEAQQEDQKKLWRCLISAARNYIEADERYELRCVAGVCRLLELLMSRLPCGIISENEYLARRSISQRMGRLVSYIDANYQYPVRLAEVADTEGITPTHLSHFFKDNFGMSFQQYLNNVRFEHAMRLLDNVSMSIADVADTSGFSDTKYLTRICVERYGCKPRELRELRISGKGGERNYDTEAKESSFSDTESLNLLDEFAHSFAI